MNDLTKKEAAYDPQELERLLVAREMQAMSMA